MNALRCQRGSMALTMGLLLLGLVSILGLVEVGYLYWAKREVQKVADLAALSGAQRLNLCSSSNDTNMAARQNAVDENHFNGNLDIACVHWAADETEHGDKHYRIPDADHPRNAVYVKASLPLAPFFGFANFNGVGAEAIAANRGDPIASFSAGSRLLGLDSDEGVLSPLLNSLLGTSLGLKLLSYQGIANSNISLLSLKNLLHLDAGTVDDVLDADINVGDLLDAVVTLLDNDSDNTAEIDLSAIDAEVANIKAQVGDLDLKLGDILNVSADTSNPDTALDVDVNVADIISAALQAANGRHAAALDVSDLDLGLANVALKLAIIEPPKLGIGRPGYNSDGTPRTLAHTAQLRLKLDVKVLNSLGDNQNLLDLNLALVRLKVYFPTDTSLTEIPLNLELVPAEAWLDDMQCHVNRSGHQRNVARLTIRPGALNLFLGHLPDDTYGNIHKRWEDIVADTIASKDAYADLLGLGIKVTALADLIKIAEVTARLEAYASAPVVRENDATHEFIVDPSLPVDQQPNMNWSVDTGQELLGSALSALFTQKLLHARLQTEGLGLVNDVVDALVNSITPIVTALLSILKPALDPVFQLLDTLIVGPLLHGLGIDVGAADVNLTSVNCNTGVQLVY